MFDPVFLRQPLWTPFYTLWLRLKSNMYYFSFWSVFLVYLYVCHIDNNKIMGAIP